MLGLFNPKPNHSTKRRKNKSSHIAKSKRQYGVPTTLENIGTYLVFRDRLERKKRLRVY